MYAPKDHDALRIDPGDAFLLIARRTSRVIDVRSESEFARGSFPESLNLPILDDAERVLVGTCYKERGAKAAIDLGHSLVSGEKKRARIRAWMDVASGDSPILLSCARGGMRSSFAQQWLREAGFPVRRIREGYKGLRNEALGLLESFPRHTYFVVIAGRAGSGKTKLFKRTELSSSVVDLEALARHSGSSFGSLFGEQPSQANFENALAVNAQQILSAGGSLIFVEDESRSIGRITLPSPWVQRMAAAPRVLVEVEMEERLENILSDYVVRFLERSYDGPEEALAALHRYLIDSVAKISRRLGGLLSKQVSTLVDQAIAEQRRSGDLRLHKQWIEVLLRQYYDPCYDYDLNKRREQITFRGSPGEVLEFLGGSHLRTMG